MRKTRYICVTARLGCIMSPSQEQESPGAVTRYWIRTAAFQCPGRGHRLVHGRLIIRSEPFREDSGATLDVDSSNVAGDYTCDFVLWLMAAASGKWQPEVAAQSAVLVTRPKEPPPLQLGHNLRS